MVTINFKGVSILILFILLAGLVYGECSDTDNGKDYSKFGKCTDGIGEKADYCSADLTILVEYSCGSNGCVASSSNCPNGCLFGRCINNPVFVPIEFSGMTFTTILHTSSTSRLTTTTTRQGSSISGTLKFFYSDTCGWCEKEKPVISQVEAEYPNIVVERIYASSGNADVQKYQVTGIPVSVFIQPGCTRRQVGYLEYNSFINWMTLGSCWSG